MPTKLDTKLAAKKAEEVFSKVADLMGYLHDRWQDEKEYEDINEYRAAADKALAPFGLKVKKFYSGRPFGFSADLMGVELRIIVKPTYSQWQLRPIGHAWGR